MGEGETVTLSLEGIPNGALMRYESNTSYFFNVSGGTIVTENIVIDGNSPYVPRSKTSGAIFSVSKGGSITTKSGTVVQHVRSSTHSVIYLSSTAGATATATIEDLTVTGAGYLFHLQHGLQRRVHLLCHGCRPVYPDGERRYFLQTMRRVCCTSSERAPIRSTSTTAPSATTTWATAARSLPCTTVQNLPQR